MPPPLVSVIVGVYNKERFVGECLHSVLAQTYQNWELIVVDDASTDGSWDIIQNVAGADARVRPVKRSQNSHHPSVPRNDGVRLSHGGILMFLDGDDAWIPTKVERQVQWMQEHPQYRFCHALCWKVDDESRILEIRHGQNLPGNGDYRKALLERMWVSISTMAVTRDLWNEVGPFNEGMEWAERNGGRRNSARFTSLWRSTGFRVRIGPRKSGRALGGITCFTPTSTPARIYGRTSCLLGRCTAFSPRLLWRAVNTGALAAISQRRVGSHFRHFGTPLSLQQHGARLAECC